jgi:tetratricopeptide (TPR) repeat protein
MADTVRRGVMKLKPARSVQIASALRVLAALCWGLLAGLVVCVPVGYYYRFTRESRPISETLDYTRRNIASINGDWNLFQKLQSRNAFLGNASPAKKLSPHVRSSLIQAADEIVNRYRNSSDPDIQQFDWQKAVVCLRHALEIEPGDSTIQGKLALCIGYVNLVQASSQPSGNPLAATQTAHANFNEAAALIPGAPDPHLALARIYIYDFKNIGKGAAELQEAQRLGFQLGPREMEQQADGYRFRANVELAEARMYRGKSRESEERYLRLAQRDFERARQLYEPIVGFSNASVALRQVDDDDRARKQLDDSLKLRVKRPRKPVRLRARRWQ